VLALDVSDEMLRLGQANLAGVGNLQWVLGSGADLDVIGDCWVDDVFSSITLQHVPSPAIVLRYLQEANRVLRRGGQAALQMRHPGPLPWGVNLAGHLGACRAGPPGLVGGLARDPPPGAPTAPGSLHVRAPRRATTAWPSAPVGAALALTRGRNINPSWTSRAGKLTLSARVADWPGCGGVVGLDGSGAASRLRSG
jgi:SAM-dependent methyltransferase